MLNFVEPSAPTNLQIKNKEMNRLIFSFSPPVCRFDRYVGQCISYEDPQAIVNATVSKCQGNVLTSNYYIQRVNTKRLKLRATLSAPAPIQTTA